jgi:hypothetical protein
VPQKGSEKEELKEYTKRNAQRCFDSFAMPILHLWEDVHKLPDRANRLANRELTVIYRSKSKKE